MGAPILNKNAEKKWTPELKAEAYAAFCEWMRQGKSRKSFSFFKGNFYCIAATLEAMLEKEDSFEPEHLQACECVGYAYWEGVLEDGARGVNKDVNPACLQMKMRNQYDWDKKEDASKTEGAAHEAKEFAQKIEAQARSSSSPSPEKSS